MGSVAIFKGKLVKFLAKAGLLMPSRPETERSASPTAGEIAFNNTTNKLEMFNGSTWITFDNAPSADPTDIAGIPPTLDLDFTTEFPSIITFTRSSTATYFDKDGFLKIAQTNAPRIDYNPDTKDSNGFLVEPYVVNSLSETQNFKISWGTSLLSVVSNAALSVDGAISGSLLYPSTTGNANRYIYTTVSSVSPGYNTLSIYAKLIDYTSGSGPGITLRVRNSADTSDVRVNFNLTTGVQGAASASGADFSLPSASIDKLDNGWYRCKLSFNVVSGLTSPQVQLWYGDYAPSSTSTGRLYIYGAQLEYSRDATSYIPSTVSSITRSSTATYYDSDGIIRTAIVNQARTSYNPTPNKLHLAPRLLLEPSATNSFLQSENLATSWLFTRATQSSSTVQTPDGSTVSKAIVLSNDGTPGATYAYQFYTATAGTAFTVSAFVRKPSVGIPFNNLCYITDYTEGGQVVFNLSSKAMLPSLNCLYSDIQELPNGWFRISATFMPSSSGTYSISPYKFISSGTSDSMLCWGAQIETGYGSTSYIPTTTAAVSRSSDSYLIFTGTRSDDKAFITGANFTGWYQWDEGTIYCESDLKTVASNIYGYRFMISDGSNNNAMYSANWFSSNRLLSVTTEGVSWAILSTATNPLISSKSAASYKNDDFVAYLDVGTNLTDTSGVVPTRVNQMSIGCDYAGSAALNGHIRRIVFWPKRLDNTKLQLMTK